MNEILVFELTILVLAIFLGIEVISKVPTMLHTPLMSGTNAIHGIVIVGAILVLGRADADTLTLVVGFVAVVLGTANVVGGFVVTDRMLEMFKQRRPQKPSRMSRSTTDLLYLVTIVTFILALRFLSSPKRARQGNLLGAAGMALAIVVTLAQEGLGNFVWIGLAMAIGAVIGVVGARSVKMTAMPQMVALFNGVGGGAVALIALAEFHNLTPLPGELPAEESITILLSALIGSISFSGSLIAFAKLQELLSGRPIVYPGQQFVNGGVLLTALVLGGLIVAGAERDIVVVALIVAALTFGVLFVLPIGGADMPVVISLLNAFTGLAASAAGFLLHNNVLIVAGALVGASGTLLTLLMGRAMNRSIGNVLFGAFGSVHGRQWPRRARGRSQRELDHARGSGDHAQLRPQGRLRPWLRARRRPGAARRACARGAAGGEGRRRPLRHPSRRRPDARAHERPPR